MIHCPFPGSGRFWRGNLHTHSNRSDGALSPEETARIYQDAGYDFLAITDHFRPQYNFPLTDTRPLRTKNFTTLLGAELHGPRTAFSSEWHILALGLPLDFTPPGANETGPETARRARAAGAFIGMAHPAASILTLEDAETLDSAHAVEVYNALAAREERADSWHLTDVLLNRGHQLSAYAADDAHFTPGDPPGCAAWVQVWAETLNPEELLAALKMGRYYSSTGPQLHRIETSDGTISIECSPASKIVVTGGAPGVQVREGTDLTSATFPTSRFENTFCRVTIEDASGHRAWSNPIRFS
ncbi:CehA/McbA family metallohydrolase [Kineosporia babensis]|uniref:CehA/McbA family metallohydrolase n=1 Tax=Kineosporia babensis TaxID=499548 RepID=A0A9X1N7V6_9ACTN|nr:CehA/McbA family metallohydrolase [Kineosporia babensis]MCD5309982.1 CehA/McbA family metallohydrolase [Kineosporia babensis]